VELVKANATIVHRLITSVAVSLPIGFYIWRQGPGRPKPTHSAHGGHKKHGGEHGEEHVEEPKDEPKEEPKKEPKGKGGDEKSKPEKTGDSSEGPTKEMDDNQENVSVPGSNQASIIPDH
jgi:hypothetical protein